MARRASTPGPTQPSLPFRDLITSLARATDCVNAATFGVRAVATVPPSQAQLTYSQVIVSIAHLQAAVTKLSEAYINHANTVLSRGSTVDIANVTRITNSLYEGNLLGASVGARATSPGAKSEMGEKKKRKRAPPDPNAPKRALTPFFLFMQHNRSKIAAELGDSAKPKDVSDEGTRRWAEMPEPEKEHWKNMYADNLAVYKEKMKAYKAGLPFSDDAKAANQLQQEADRAEATAAEESDEEEEEEEGEESPEPVREPTPPRAGKRRRSEAAKTAKEVASPAETKKASPEKKKTRTPAAREKKAQEETPVSTRKTTAAEKRSKKKRKSEAGADE
ncbi:hypothetical protein ETB97_005685 [Aspergillus alliaceus]|uniref:HMG box domain-containing protein n=1 Tax=Petromyces alliaceus TaxID=209559 RepID=A0A5N7CR05_PETAA|nr:hypothetical protein BDV23DRAFT_143215 [Aspergillus alliaceus]KAF5857507.1 hypothetical protein ETB97_005685 [Aspergillus burnettii]